VRPYSYLIIIRIRIWIRIRVHHKAEFIAYHSDPRRWDDIPRPRFPYENTCPDAASAGAFFSGWGGVHNCKCDDEREALNCKGGVDVGSEADEVPACDEGIVKAVKSLEASARALKKPPCYQTKWVPHKSHWLDKVSQDLKKIAETNPKPRTDGVAALSG